MKTKVLCYLLCAMALTIVACFALAGCGKSHSVETKTKISTIEHGPAQAPGAKPICTDCIAPR